MISRLSSLSSLTSGSVAAGVPGVHMGVDRAAVARRRWAGGSGGSSVEARGLKRGEVVELRNGAAQTGAITSLALTDQGYYGGEEWGEEEQILAPWRPRRQ